MKVLLALLLLAPALAGCIGPAGTAEPAAVACVHPHPCGDGAEWPLGLEGPFALREFLHLPLAGHDGTALDGYVYLPEVPDGVRVPVVVWAHAYFEGNYPAADDPRYWEDGVWWGAGLSARTLVENGYAVAYYSVRGTGSSGGCFDMFGADEQQDLAALVEQLAAEPWSNGRVGMMGLSYHGTTPWEAAIHAPPALKTIVVAGMVSDLYTFYHSPQGAVFTVGAGFQTLVHGLVSGPSLMGRPPADRVLASVVAQPERLCPEAAEAFAGLWRGTVSDARNPAFWDERRLIAGFPNVTAAVLLTHGFQDAWGSGHQTQENAAWHALPATTPKWMVEGQWGHEFPHMESVPDLARLPDFGDDILAWLDHWLKGIGPEPVGVGRVDYQDDTGAWRSTSAWPPAEVREEVLYLAESALRADATDAAPATFRPVPDLAGSAGHEMANFPGTNHGMTGPLCTHAATTPLGLPQGVLFLTEPATADVLVAGDPHAHLLLESDAPGGIVSFHLIELEPDWRCDGLTPRGVRPWSQASIDLRHHAGNIVGEAFPVGTPTAVRLDFVNFAERLEAGNRLALLASYGDIAHRTGQPFAPTIRLHAGADAGASHLVLPVIEGTLGGAAPTLEYPARPFVP